MARVKLSEDLREATLGLRILPNVGVARLRLRKIHTRRGEKILFRIEVVGKGGAISDLFEDVLELDEATELGHALILISSESRKSPTYYLNRLRENLSMLERLLAEGRG